MRFFILLLCLLVGCGTTTKAKPYASLNKDEAARQALDELDYAKAIELYKEIIEEEPEGYERYRFLAAAYAGAAGFDILAAANANLGGSNSLVNSLGSLLPADPTQEEMDQMTLARDTLLSIPAELRSKDNTDVAYAAGAATQLEFYQAAYSVMYINRFAQLTPSGTLDPDRLATMTDEDVTRILDNFAQVAASGDQGAPAGAQKVLSKISEQEGSTQKDKLINYLNSSKKPTST